MFLESDKKYHVDLMYFSCRVSCDYKDAEFWLRTCESFLFLHVYVIYI